MPDKEKYPILVADAEGKGVTKQHLCDTHAENVERVKALQVRTNYYSDAERKEVVEEMGWEEEWLEDGALKRHDLPAFRFKQKIAKILFPRAPFDDADKYIDFEVVEEALGDFLSRTGRGSQNLNEQLNSLVPFLIQAMATNDSKDESPDSGDDT